MRLILCIVAAVAANCLGSAARADDIARLYAQVLKNPADTQANLHYAQAAEENGKLRWALMAYERVVANDPGNAEAQAGLQRVRRKLQPNTTQYTVEAGAAFESNPRYSSNGSRGEAQLFASGAIRDERTLGDLRWRTNALALGLWHGTENDLNYGYAGATTGPVFGFFGDSNLVLGIGGGAASFDHRFYFGEAIASATIEKYAFGALQSVQFRTGYRDYDSFFPTTTGTYYDIAGKFAVPDVFREGNIVTFEPWARWSAIGGTGLSPLLTSVQPGSYDEFGARAAFLMPVAANITLGPTVTYFNRSYNTDVVPATGARREDTVGGPGASVWIANPFTVAPNVLTAWKIEYQYLKDNSNDPAHTFNDHVITTSLVFRF
jgi:hypothetical protein